jgi:hypothetical protein
MHKFQGPMAPDEDEGEVEHGIVKFIKGENERFFLVLHQHLYILERKGKIYSEICFNEDS